MPYRQDMIIAISEFKLEDAGGLTGARDGNVIAGFQAQPVVIFVGCGDGNIVKCPC